MRLDAAFVQRVRLMLFFAGICAFVAIYAYTFAKIIRAQSGTPPTLDSSLVYLGTALAGVFGAFFAGAFGIQRNTPTGDDPARTKGRQTGLGRVLLPESRATTQLLGEAAIIAYLLVGIASWFVSVIWADETPEVTKALAAGFVGYFLAILTATTSSS